MINNNLQHVNLGAPSSIECGASPNCELSVQSMVACQSLSLTDDGSTKCTKQGAMHTGLTLLKQAVDEHVEESSTDGYDITFSSTTYKNVCLNGGSLQMAMKHGSTTVPAFWIIYDVMEGSSDGISINEDGLLSVGNKYAYLKVIAFDKSDFSHKVEKVFVFGARYGSTDIADRVAQYPSYAVLLSHSSSRIARGLIERGTILPPLADKILSYHNTFPIINNLALAGTMKALMSDGTSYIDTNFATSTTSYEECAFAVDTSILRTNDATYGIYGSDYNGDNCGIVFYGGFIRINLLSQYDMRTLLPQENTAYVFKIYNDNDGFCQGSLNDFVYNAYNTNGRRSYIKQHIFTCGNSSGRMLISTEMEFVYLIQNESMYVPYLQDGKYGIIDITTGSFVTTPTGTLNIKERTLL